MSGTPGPWTTSSRVVDLADDCRFGSQEQDDLADVASDVRELEAINADLLEALERIAAGSTEVFDDDLQEMVPVALCFHEMEEIAAAAIAKARAGK